MNTKALQRQLHFVIHMIEVVFNVVNKFENELFDNSRTSPARNADSVATARQNIRDNPNVFVRGRSQQFDFTST